MQNADNATSKCNTAFMGWTPFAAVFNSELVPNAFQIAHTPGGYICMSCNHTDDRTFSRKCARSHEIVVGGRCVNKRVSPATRTRMRPRAGGCAPCFTDARRPAFARRAPQSRRRSPDASQRRSWRSRARAARHRWRLPRRRLRHRAASTSEWRRARSGRA